MAGSTVNIGSGDKTILTLTTGSDGTASGKLPINSGAGAGFWGKQVKALTGYDLYKGHRAFKATFKAKSGDPVTVTNTKTPPDPPVRHHHVHP